MNDLIIATQNAHKAAEIAAILPAGCRLRTLADFPDHRPAEESGRTFAANAALKATALSAEAPGCWVLADDSGLCVDALSSSPGILSARFAGEHGNDAANVAKLIRELSVLRCLEPFTARFVCALCLAKDGRVVAEFEGVLEGCITLYPRGTHGFGYDPVFEPVGYAGATLAELAPDLKNSISHRARALSQLAAWWSKHAGA